MAKKKADLGSKRLISIAPTPWVQWLTDLDDIKYAKLVSPDFQWIGRNSDALLQVSSSSLGDFLVLSELQLRYDAWMPSRMNAYAALAHEKYHLPVYPVLINILPPSPNIMIPCQFHSEILGLESKQDYQVINLWEMDVELVFNKPLPSLLPFVPVLNGGQEEKVVRKALRLLRKDTNLQDFEPLLAFFASFELPTSMIEQIMRWDMAVLLESPWYQEILELGEAKGEARGEARGEIKGEAKAELRALQASIELALEIKFGTDGLKLFSDISDMTDIRQLQKIKDKLKTAKTLTPIQRLCR